MGTSASVTTPQAVQAGDTELLYVSTVSVNPDPISTPASWTLPAAVTGRDQVIGAGGGRVSAALADSGGTVVTGTYPAQTATVGATASGKGAMISLVLVPGS